jgi:hypothetical protein
MFWHPTNHIFANSWLDLLADETNGASKSVEVPRVCGTKNGVLAGFDESIVVVSLHEDSHMCMQTV